MTNHHTHENAAAQAPLTGADDTPPGEAARTDRRRTRAHTATQLRQALHFTEDEFARCRAAGLIPDPDLKTPRWSGPKVDQLVADRERLLEELPDDFADNELRAALGLDYGAWRRGRDAAVIPDPDRPPYWTRALARQIIADRDLMARIPPQPLGARRCAEALAAATGLQVQADDITELAERGLLASVGEYEGWPLYDPDVAAGLAKGPDNALAAVVAARQAWLADSITPGDAAVWLGWTEAELASQASDHGIRPGRFDRYARADIAALAGDEALIEEVRRARLMGPTLAAEHLDIRRVDLDHLVAAGWLSPVRHELRELRGHSGRLVKDIAVPLYTLGDLEDVLTIPGVDWEAVRAVRPGQPSPLREHTRLPIRRATAIRGFAADLAAQHQIAVWPRWHTREDVWVLDWEPGSDGTPTHEQVQQALLAHPAAARHADHVRLSSEVGDVISWARRMRQPGQAVIVDCETTGLDGVIIEIAVLAADGSGRVLLNTLVSPGSASISADAQAVHGLRAADLRGAPTWEQVLPRFLNAVGQSAILAYNADFDRGRVAATQHASGLDRSVLPARDQWFCLMQALTVWRRSHWWLPLGGAHRALGDAREAERVLATLCTAPASRTGSRPCAGTS
ncbi:3'-5' exonuclease [Nonomuraea sp. NPDC046802]|uniref:3'-5' exonuclease n=1 Tax=Nonomuraea sp. NPDC046802 TaxID=3154919 RepID=UPI0033F9C2E7